MFTYSAFADEIHPSFSVQMEVLKKYGISHIEARGINGKNIADYTPAEAKELKKQLDDNGFALSALGSPIGKIKITDPFAPELDRFRRVLELAEVFETKYIRMFSFYTDAPEGCRDDVMERWSQYLEAARGLPVILLHENEKGIYGDNAERCLDLLQTMNSPQMRATFDPANFVQCGVKPMEALAKLRPYVEYMHIKDALFADGAVVPSGQGDGQVEEILTALFRDGWSGFTSLEPHLGDFAGYSDLEENADEKKEPSDEKKFRLAYTALDEIVRRIESCR